MDQRRDFYSSGSAGGANRRALCRQFGISAQTGYTWLTCWQMGDQTLAERSRCPHSSPGRSDAALEQRILEVRDAHPAWGGRKIMHWL